MPRLALIFLLLIAPAVLGCGDPTSDPYDPNCGGCAAPPTCNPDGTAPSPYPRCSCGCIAGDELFGGRCNENACIVPYADGGPGDGGPDAGT